MAQDVPELLKLEDAILLALENNYDIKISENQLEINENNFVRGNAGYLPTIGAQASYSYSNQNTRLEFADPNQRPIEVDGAESQNINAGLSLDYTLWNGRGRKFQFEKLGHQRNLSELETKNLAEITCLNIINSYLNISALQSEMKVKQKAIEISAQRYERASENFKYGNINKLELLNAQVDLSNDSSAYLESKLNYGKGINGLNVLLGIDPSLAYEVDSSFAYDEIPEINTLKDQLLQNNSQILAQKYRSYSAESDVNIIGAEKSPSLSFNAGLNYQNAITEGSFLTNNTSIGPNAGLSLRYNIFDGNRVNRNQQNARILKENQAIGEDKLEADLISQLLQAYQDLETGQSLLKLKESNLELANTNFARSKEAYAKGLITGIELREAQLNLLNAEFGLKLQEIQNKQAETNLLFLSGNLISN